MASKINSELLYDNISAQNVSILNVKYKLLEKRYDNKPSLCL